MKQHALTFEIHHNDRGWLDAASIEFKSNTEVVIEYDLDYAAEYLGRNDRFALSVNLPVDTATLRMPLPGFILDLVPQGEPLRRLLGRYGIAGQENYSEILRRATLAPPGNVRIKEPWREIEKERPSYRHPGFLRADIVTYHTEFVAYMESHGAPVGGTTGAGGGSPKFLLREDTKGRFHAEGMLDDSKTKRAYLVKFPYTDSSNSIALAKVEKCYHDILHTLPVDVGDPIELEGHVLFIPRFDRVRDSEGRLCYHGLESMYAAHNIAIPGAMLRHEDNVLLLLKYSSEPHTDILEYLKRDLLNKMLANTDNHGRNTSLIKKDNTIRLSPLYDLTAMQFFTSDFIVELTKWYGECRVLKNRVAWIERNAGIALATLKASLKEFYEAVCGLDEAMRRAGVPDDFVLRSKTDRGEVLRELKEL